jgi:hypothetical protein
MVEEGAKRRREMEKVISDLETRRDAVVGGLEKLSSQLAGAATVGKAAAEPADTKPPVTDTRPPATNTGPMTSDDARAAADGRSPPTEAKPPPTEAKPPSTPSQPPPPSPTRQ